MVVAYYSMPRLLSSGYTYSQPKETFLFLILFLLLSGALLSLRGVLSVEPSPS